MSTKLVFHKDIKLMLKEKKKKKIRNPKWTAEFRLQSRVSPAAVSCAARQAACAHLAKYKPCFLADGQTAPGRSLIVRSRTDWRTNTQTRHRKYTTSPTITTRNLKKQLIIWSSDHLSGRTSECICFCQKKKNKIMQIFSRVCFCTVFLHTWYEIFSSSQTRHMTHIRELVFLFVGEEYKL